MDAVAKPPELLALHGVTTELFETLRAWFEVPDRVALDLSDIDAAVTQMADPQMIAALAMRKLQALHLLSTPGVRTSTDVVVTMVQDLHRALLQAPNMHLKRVAAQTDWDAAWAELDGPGGGGDGAAADAAPASTGAADPEVERFRALHAALHEAVRAVLEVGDGAIVYLE